MALLLLIALLYVLATEIAKQVFYKRAGVV
jgi:hypothetical protein